MSLVPVEHDPFGTDGAVHQAQAQSAETDAPVQTRPQGNPQQADHNPHGVPGQNYPTADAAAVAALQEINPTSQRYGLEYAGRVYHKWLGLGDYSFTPAAQGDVYSSDPGNSVLVPLLHSLGINAGAYHTHVRGLDPTVDENYSTRDKEQSDSEKAPSFLATPRGMVYKYTPDSNQPSEGQVSVLGHADSPFADPSKQPPTYPTVFGPR